MADLPSPNDSILARYTGEAFKALDGNAAAPYIAVARTLLGQLRNRLALGGVAAGAIAVTLPDGTRIKAGVYGAINKMWIEPPVADETLREEKPVFPYLSGLLEYAASTQSGLAAQVYPAREGLWLELDWYQYVTLGGYYWPLTVLSGDSMTGRDRFAVQWIKNVLPPFPPPPETMDFTGWPGRYTGRMRNVAQKLWGRRLSNPYSDNCGIWEPDGTEPSIDKRRWMIQITRTGIYAFPVVFEDERQYITDYDEASFLALTADAQARYDYGLRRVRAIPSAVTENIADIDRHSNGIALKYRLLAETALDAIYVDAYGDEKATATPWYQSWAFNATGREAQIVLIGQKSYSTTRLYYAQRYKLSITQDDQGRPANAVIDLIDGDYLQTATSAPGINQEQPLSLPKTTAVAEFMYWGRPNGDWAGPKPSPRNAPVYVFYDRDDQEVVLRHQFQSSGTIADETRTDFPIWGVDLNDGANVTYTSCTAEGWNNSVNYSRTSRTGTYNCYTCNKTFGVRGTETCTLSETVRVRTSLYSTSWHQTGWGPPPGNYDKRMCKRYNWLGTQTFHYPHTISETTYEHVGLPFDDRAALFHYTEQNRTETPHNIQTCLSFIPHPLPQIICYTWDPVGEYWPAGVGDSSGRSGTFAVSGDGSAYTDGNCTLELNVTVPDTVNKTYKFMGVLNGAAVQIEPPGNAGYWFSQDDQYYSATVGAFSGEYIAYPWPRYDGVEHSRTNGAYPYTEMRGYLEVVLGYPTACFIGDETRGDKPMAAPKTDLHSITYEDNP